MKRWGSMSCHKSRESSAGKSGKKAEKLNYGLGLLPSLCYVLCELKLRGFVETEGQFFEALAWDHTSG